MKKQKRTRQPTQRLPVGCFDEHRFDVSPLRHRACWQKSRPSAFAPNPFDPRSGSGESWVALTLGEENMKPFDLDKTYWADCTTTGEIHIGEAYHIVRNSSGGSVSTPIARYFVWPPPYIEGCFKHTRVDCFVRDHELSPAPDFLGKLLVTGLIREGLLQEPFWLSFHKSDEIGGLAYGEVFGDDDGET